MQLLPPRLSPGVDLRRMLEDAATRQTVDSAFVIAGIGSLVEASLRYAGAATESTIAGPLEILSVSGTLSSSGAHLHDRQERRRGYKSAPEAEQLVAP